MLGLDRTIEIVFSQCRDQAFGCCTQQIVALIDGRAGNGGTKGFRRPVAGRHQCQRLYFGTQRSMAPTDVPPFATLYKLVGNGVGLTFAVTRTRIAGSHPSSTRPMERQSMNR